MARVYGNLSVEEAKKMTDKQLSDAYDDYMKEKDLAEDDNNDKSTAAHRVNDGASLQNQSTAAYVADKGESLGKHPLDKESLGKDITEKVYATMGGVSGSDPSTAAYRADPDTYAIGQPRVFVSGSMTIKTLSPYAQAALDSYMADDAYFLVGDAPGIDRVVQEYLKAHDYKNVCVYHTGDKIRNKVNQDWPDKAIPSNGAERREFYTQKDIAMTQDCTEGFVIWDGKSEGTKANIDRLKDMAKPVKVENQSQRTYLTSTGGKDLSKSYMDQFGNSLEDDFSDIYG